VSECDREATIMRRFWVTRGCCAMKKKRINCIDPYCFDVIRDPTIQRKHRLKTVLQEDENGDKWRSIVNKVMNEIFALMGFRQRRLVLIYRRFGKNYRSRP
jgi:hypothetical protein